MKLFRGIQFRIRIIPIIFRYGFGHWYAFRDAPDWLVEMAAAKWNPQVNTAFTALWNEANKEKNMRKHQHREKMN